MSNLGLNQSSDVQNLMDGGMYPYIEEGNYQLKNAMAAKPYSAATNKRSKGTIRNTDGIYSTKGSSVYPVRGLRKGTMHENSTVFKSKSNFGNAYSIGGNSKMVLP